MKLFFKTIVGLIRVRLLLLAVGGSALAFGGCDPLLRDSLFVGAQTAVFSVANQFIADLFDDL